MSTTEGPGLPDEPTLNQPDPAAGPVAEPVAAAVPPPVPPPAEPAVPPAAQPLAPGAPVAPAAAAPAPVAAPVGGYQPAGGYPPAGGPPPGTAAYDAGAYAAGPPARTATMTRKSAILIGVAALLIGLIGGLAIGWGVWHNSGGPDGGRYQAPQGQFPGANGRTGQDGRQGNGGAPNGFPGGQNVPGGPNTQTGPNGQGGGQGGRIGFPIAAGKVTNVSGNTVQVEGPNGTTTVTLSDSTAVTKTTTGDSKDVSTGVCVRAEGSSSGGDATATAIQVTQPTSDGTCQTFRVNGRTPGGTGTATTTTVG